jgi:hypothetical protein
MANVLHAGEGVMACAASQQGDGSAQAARLPPGISLDLPHPPSNGEACPINAPYKTPASTLSKT